MADEPVPRADEDHIFYNVLPPERSGGALTSPTSDTLAAPNVEPSSLAPAPMVSSSAGSKLPTWLNRRLIIVLAAAIVILGLAGFGIYRLLNSPAAELPVPVNTPTETEIPEEEEPRQLEGVTTPADWQNRYFGSETCQNTTLCGDASDPDRDGLANIEEYNATTDPNNPDSSGGGLADGDKVHVFGGSPLKTKSKDGPYTDAEYAKYGYNLETDQPYTATELAEILAKIDEFSLHQPTIATLGEEALKFYDFIDPDQASSGEALQGFDLSAAAQLDRDTQRLNTIKKIGGALLQYHEANKTYPETADFNQMVTAVRPLITVATNFSDPVNKDKYVYGYIADNTAADFTLTYYSETQNLLIKYRAQNAQQDSTKEAASAYDEQRARDLDNLRTALLLYSSHNVDSNSLQQYVFPPVDRYKTELINGNYISLIPTDPVTKLDYEYQVGSKFDTFTVKAVFERPAPGTTGMVCNQEECRTY